MSPRVEQLDSPDRSVVDIVICIHDALDHVRECLASLNRHSNSRQHLIMVDDGSSPGCRDELLRFGQAHQECTLIRNDTARGYTKAANQGLRLSRADVVILLNSDTIVTATWLDRLLACADSDPR